MKPDLLLFKQHVSEAGFQTGVDNLMWGIVDESPEYPTWPLVVIWVQAASKENYPDRYYFKFELSGYPSQAPTACPWNMEQNTRLSNDNWPKGSKFVSTTFRPEWNPNALYAPCDRLAMPGHEGWQTVFPDLWWKPTFKIQVYLHFLHRLLNSGDYASH
ncbi:hypothetical protein [Flavihumibacter sp. ZG627]|uniref:DUF7665 family protein n=1 Tax=Flavihumibacter sp. ZG627 TaxID=1463156 RepID=UPI000694369F|nr:hypothetical protein [Flavihumibacter sp. ZG627]